MNVLHPLEGPLAVIPVLPNLYNRLMQCSCNCLIIEPYASILTKSGVERFCHLDTYRVVNKQAIQVGDDRLACLLNALVMTCLLATWLAYDLLAWIWIEWIE